MCYLTSLYKYTRFVWCILKPYNHVKFWEATLKRIQIIDYVLAYITTDIDGSASAKEFVGYIL